MAEVKGSTAINECHWQSELYRERITSKQWKEMLLSNEDSVIFKGVVRKLKGKSLGCGVIEIFKERKI